MFTKEIERNSVLAWSPLPEQPHQLALGTTAGSFTESFDTNNKLEILDTSGPSHDFKIVKSIETTSGFTKIAWGRYPTLSQGIIAGGTTEGAIQLYDPAESSLICTAQKHTGTVQGLEFCPSQQSLLASAGADGEIYIWDLLGGESKDPTKYTCYTTDRKKAPQQSDVQFVTWNRKVPHILAAMSGAGTGAITIWDLRKKQPVLTFTDSSRKLHWKAAAWSPVEPLSIITTCDDDECPVALWDLRNVMMPRRFTGHSRGVWSVAWNEQDPTVVVTAGKDRTVCWNPETMEIRSEISRTAPASIGVEAVGADKWDAMAAWSPILAGRLALCSYGSHMSKVSIYSMHDPSTPTLGSVSAEQLSGPAPKWMLPRCGVAWGFGGKLVHFGAPAASPASPTPAGPAAKPVVRSVEIHTMPADEELIKRAEHFVEITHQSKFGEFCQQKAEAGEAGEQAIWKLLSAHFDGKSVREAVLTQLGLDKDKTDAEIAQLIQKLTPKLPEEEPKKEEEEKEEKKEEEKPEEKEKEEEEKKEETPAAAPADTSNLFGNADSDVFDHLSQQPAIKPAPASPEKPAAPEAKPAAPEAPKEVFEAATEGEEANITKAMLVGNIEGAVDYTMKLGRTADALVLASFGKPELFARIREEFLAKNWDIHPPMRFLHVLSNGELRHLVEGIAPANWRSALAAVCTYAKPNQFALLASLLGERLAAIGNQDAAILCFIVSGNINQVISMWVKEQEKSADPLGKSLASLVEKISVLKHAVGADKDPLPEPALTKFIEYAVLLATQGSTAVAVNFVSFLNDPRFAHTPGAMLLDRLYYSRPAGEPGMELIKPPTFTYKQLSIGGSLSKSSPRRAAPIQQPHTVTPTATRPALVPLSPVSKQPVPVQPVVKLMKPGVAASPSVNSPAHSPVLKQPGHQVGTIPTIPLMPLPMPTVPSPTIPAMPAVPSPATRYASAMPSMPAMVQPPTAMFSPVKTAPVPAPVAAPSMMPPQMLAPSTIVAPTAPRPKPENLTKPLSETIQEGKQPPDPADLEYLRNYFARALPELQKHCAGTPQESHAAETIKRLEGLTATMAHFSVEAVKDLIEFCQKIEEGKWEAADSDLVDITVEHGKEINTTVLTGLRFFKKLTMTTRH